MDLFKLLENMRFVCDMNALKPKPVTLFLLVDARDSSSASRQKTLEELSKALLASYRIEAHGEAKDIVPSFTPAFTADGITCCYFTQDSTKKEVLDVVVSKAIAQVQQQLPGCRIEYQLLQPAFYMKLLPA